MSHECVGARWEMERPRAKKRRDEERQRERERELQSYRSGIERDGRERERYEERGLNQGRSHRATSLSL